MKYMSLQRDPKGLDQVYNQFIVQIDSQPVSKTLKVRHLLQCVES